MTEGHPQTMKTGFILSVGAAYRGRPPEPAEGPGSHGGAPLRNRILHLGGIFCVISYPMNPVTDMNVLSLHLPVLRTS